MFVKPVKDLDEFVVIIKQEPVGIRDGETDLDSLADILRWNLEKDVVDADCGIVVDSAVDDMKEGLGELLFRDFPLFDVDKSCHIAVIGSLSGDGMDLVVVVIMKPGGEFGVEFIESEGAVFCFEVKVGDETVSNRAEVSLNFSTAWSVVWLGMDEDESKACGKQGQV